MKTLATALLVLLPSIAAAQRPLVRLDGVDRDAVTVSLDRPAYLVVIERRAGQRPTILYPLADSAWAVTEAGARSLAVSHRLKRVARDPTGPDQCLIGPTSVAIWRGGKVSARPTVGLCGPLFGSAQGGYGAWDDWGTHHYDFTPSAEPYLMVVAFDATVPPLFSPERIGWIWNGSAIDVARGMGQSLAATGADESAWQAAWWRPR